MVIIESSDSSSDEEDKRLKPLRRHDISDLGSSKRIVDVAEKPEVTDFPSTAFFFDLKGDVSSDNFKIPFLDPEFPNDNQEVEIIPDITKQITAHTKSLEDFVKQIEKFPSQTLAARKLRIGLKFINDFLYSSNSESQDVPSKEFNDFRSSLLEYDGNEKESYDNSDDESDEDEDEKFPDNWHHRFGDDDGEEVFFFQPNIMMNKINDTKGKQQDVSSQTIISGEIIPREASAALEFFQELIKSS